MKKHLLSVLESARAFKYPEFKGRALVTGAVATLIILGFIYLNGQIFGGNPMQKTLNKTVEAIKENNPALFEKNVDTKALSLSIVNQVLLPTHLNSADPSLGKVAGSLSALIRPTLASSLNEELVSAVSDGSFLAPTSADSNSLLTRLKDNFSGPEINFKGFGKIDQNGNEAHVPAKFYRADLKHAFALSVQLKKTNNVWKIADLPDFGLIINDLAQRKAHQLEAKNAALLEAMSEILQVSDVKKSSTSAKWAVGKGIFLSAAFTNTGKDEIESFLFQVTIADKEGATLKTFQINEDDNIAAKATLEKSWPISLNPLLPNDNKIFDLPAEELTVSIVPQAIQFKDGTSVNLLKNKDK